MPVYDLASGILRLWKFVYLRMNVEVFSLPLSIASFEPYFESSEASPCPILQKVLRSEPSGIVMQPRSSKGKDLSQHSAIIES